MDADRRAALERIKAAYPAGTLLDEAAVPDYTLPELLVCADGTPVVSAADWFARRRPELLDLLARDMFGRSPEPPAALHWELRALDADALGGRATRKEVRLYLTQQDQHHIDLLLYVPHGTSRPPATWVGLNYWGNQSVVADPGVSLYDGWVRGMFRPEQGAPSVVENRATEASRGRHAQSLPVERLLERGFAVATACCSDIAPDREDVFAQGVFAPFVPEGGTPPEDGWGVLAAWAWGMCRMLDYLVTDPDLDPHRVIAHGTSRLGKAALWAAALDQRWGAVSPNESGCGGAALSRRRFGETVGRITATFPTWFCRRFQAYSGREDALPFDQHMLIALAAPRPCYIASAEDDLWSDPRGEFLGALHASPAWRLLGGEGLAASEMPAVHAPISGALAYHLRSGGHGVNAWDWEHFMDWAEASLPGE